MTEENKEQVAVQEKKFNIKKVHLAYIVIAVIIIAALSLWFYTAYLPGIKEIKEVRVEGHNHIYTFSYDIKQTLKIPVNDEEELIMALLRSDKINIAYRYFNQSSLNDSKSFEVLMINVIGKLTTYFAYEGKIITGFPVYYIDEENRWHNSTGDVIEKPDFGNNSILWLEGPNTGAEDTSVSVVDNNIYISGTSHENLIKAGDRFILAVMRVSL